MVEIKVLEALQNLGYSVKLYRTLVTGFIEKYKGIDIEIYDGLIARDIETSRRHAHSMKGLAGNLGAVQLQLFATTLEKELKELLSTDVEDVKIIEIVNTSWTDFSKSLEETVVCLVELLMLKDDEIKQQEVYIYEQVIDTHTFVQKEISNSIERHSNKTMSHQLLRMIGTYNYVTIQEFLDSQCELEMQQLLTNRYEEFLTCINNFEYDRAKAIIREEIRYED